MKPCYPLWLKPKQGLGQNWLTNETYIRQIVGLGDVKLNDKVIEIGPGLGALTFHLLANKSNKLYLLEKDARLMPYLDRVVSAYSERVVVMNTDALTIDYRDFGNQLVLYANLPFNITTPMLEVLIKFQDCFKRVVLLVQKEVAWKWTAQPTSKHYGKASILMQSYFTCCQAFTVTRENFVPQPKVDAAAVIIEPNDVNKAITSQAWFNKVLNMGFSQRRKYLSSSLKSLVHPTQSFSFNLKRRPQELTIQDWIRLSEDLYQLSGSRDSIDV